MKTKLLRRVRGARLGRYALENFQRQSVVDRSEIMSEITRMYRSDRINEFLAKYGDYVCISAGAVGAVAGGIGPFLYEGRPSLYIMGGMLAGALALEVPMLLKWADSKDWRGRPSITPVKEKYEKIFYDTHEREEREKRMEEILSN